MAMSETASILLDRIRERGHRIVVIGDNMVDRWIHGHMAACQDGCPKFVQDSVKETAGGAANAAASIRHWGARVSLYGYTEHDCPRKCRYMEDGKIVFRADEDGPYDRTGYQWARDLALDMVSHARVVLLSDYDKGFLQPAFVLEVADLCWKLGIPCVADVKREPELYRHCITKANEDWDTKHPGASDVLTRGALVPLMKHDAVCACLPPVACVNHVGAGDCFVAHLALGLAYGFSIKEAATLAYSAGRVYVQRPHSCPPQPSEVLADMLLTNAVGESVGSPVSVV